MASAVCIFVVFPLGIKTGNRVANEFDWIQFRALAFQSHCPKLPCSLSALPFLKALSTLLVFCPCFVFFASLLLLLFLTQEQKPVPVRARWPGAQECGRALGAGWPVPGAHSGWQPAGAGEAPAPCSEGLESTADVSSSLPGRGPPGCYSH